MNTKSTLYSLCFLLITVSATAQVRPTLQAGLVHSTWKGDAKQSLSSLIDETNGVITSNGRTGFYIGGGIDLPLGDVVSVEPGLVYTQRGYGLKGNLTINDLKIAGVNARAISQMQYVDVPLMVKIKPAGGLTLFAGPQVSYLAKNNLRAEVAILGFSLLNSDMDITDQFNRWDVGVKGGAGYEFENGLGIVASYERGFNRIDNNQNFKVFNEGLKAGLTYRF